MTTKRLWARTLNNTYGSNLNSKKITSEWGTAGRQSPVLGGDAGNQFRMDWRYWEGVTFSHFLKVVQKLVSLLKPVLNAMFLMDISVDFRRYFAADRRVLIRY